MTPNTPIRLSWPNPILSPNSRKHWTAKAKAKAAALIEGRGAALEAGWHKHEWGDGPIRLSIVFCPPDKRRRDLDNMLSSIKAHLDGIAFAMGVDDNQFRPSIDIAGPVKGGSVTVRAVE